VLFVVGFRRLLSVTTRMDGVRPCYMGMVRGSLVLSAFMVFCRFAMVAGSVGKMFLCFLVVLGSFFRHCSPPLVTQAAFKGDRCFRCPDLPAKS
jgi:hypothetical protein